MHYSWELVVNTGNTVNNPATLNLGLPCGIVEEVDIYFPYGCGRVIRAQLYDGATQILPTNVEGFYALDGDTSKAPMYYDLSDEYNILQLRAWTITGQLAHTLTVMVYVKGPNEPDLLAVLKAQVDCMNKQIDLIRSLI